MSGDLENLIWSTVERVIAARYSERHGLVTSYDPEKYLAKVTFQPEGQESGWVPIETGHVGEGYGIVIGLQPGSGNSGDTGNPGNSENASQDAHGDQVIVRYQEGDFESGKIVQRVHSDKDKAPTAQSGEMIFWTKFKKSGGGPDSAPEAQGGTGQKIYFKNDGSITVEDGNGQTQVHDGKGNITVDASTNITVTSG